MLSVLPTNQNTQFNLELSGDNRNASLCSRFVSLFLCGVIFT